MQGDLSGTISREHGHTNIQTAGGRGSLSEFFYQSHRNSNTNQSVGRRRGSDLGRAGRAVPQPETASGVSSNNIAREDERLYIHKS